MGPWHLECCCAGAYRAVVLLSPHRFLQRAEEIQRSLCPSEIHWRMIQVRPRAESHPREGPTELRWPTKWHGGWRCSVPCHMQCSLPREIPWWWVAGRAVPLPLAYSSLSPTGTTDAPHAAARRRMPAVIRMALRALRRVCTCSCIRGQEEERHEAANTRQLPETTN